MVRYICWRLENGLLVRVREASSLPGQHRPHAVQPVIGPTTPATNHRTRTVATFTSPTPLPAFSGNGHKPKSVTSAPHLGLHDPAWGRRPRVPMAALAVINAAIAIAT